MSTASRSGPVDVEAEAAPEAEVIAVWGARQNNLANIDVTIPKGALTVVTGVSGSGKSSLAFETLYAEGQRRYVESFSTYARQFLERMDRPAVDAIDGLIPAVAIEQRNTIRSARSTLATLTELTDHLKLLFAHRAALHCRVCGELVRHDLPGPSVEALLAEHADARAVITFPFHVGTEDDATLAWSYLGGEGYHRVYVDGRATNATEVEVSGTVAVVADRAVLRADDRQRLVESLEAAYRMGQGRATVHVEGADPVVLSVDSTHCGAQHPAPRAGLFSFSSPLGACPTCNGFGRVTDIDLDRVIPDTSKSLSQGAIRPWTGPKRSPERRWVRAMAETHGVDLEAPWRDLSEAHKQLVIEGDKGARRLRLQGIRGWFQWLKRKSYKMHVRVLLSRYRAYLTCPDCEGTRFQPDALLFRVEDKTIADVLSSSVQEVRGWLRSLPPARDDRALASVLDQLHHRLSYLDRVGLGYLTLNRAGRTLSGGEVQRANLTSALGSGLVNTLFVLDEPTIGLHPRDTERLSDLLDELTERDNTVVVVEHDPDILRVADHVIDLGPGPGVHGGEIVYQGAPDALADAKGSATARALAARAHPRVASTADHSSAPSLVIRGPRAWNLKGDDVAIPLERLTVLTGVSGSGKSTLLETVLHRGILRQRGLVTDAPGAHDDIEGLEAIDEVHWIDQSPPAQNPRANPATYVKAWDGIRALFAKQPLAKLRGYTPGTFSFNAGTGRCQACEGAGHERIEMQFLSDVLLTCTLCDGARFVPEVLEVTWEGRTIADMLALTVEEAMDALPPRSKAHGQLGALMRVGLGYLTLGQSLATLSGGESQRLKIAHHLGQANPTRRKRRSRTKRALFLLDEPTTGLHLADVDRLIVNLEELAAEGHTVVVVEHHLDVIAAADHLIELGPEGGDAGGHLVFEGAPAALTVSDTPTGEHLARWLQGVAPLDAPRATVTRDTGESEAGRPAASDAIEIVGARVHNLKDVSVTLPRTGRTVVSGVSGSGKSTLAFDLVFAEGQRRFLDCVSPYARQYITQLGRPDATRIAGIPPTVAIEQRTTRGGARSVVANATEISSFLRLLFARLGSDATAASQRRTPEELAEWLHERHADREIGICAPVIKARMGFHKPVFARAVRMGHAEILVDDVLMPPSPTPRLRRRRLHTIDWVLGRTMTDDLERLTDLLERASTLSGGQVRVLLGHHSVPEVMGPYDVVPAGSHVRRQQFDPRLFSPHTRLGACPSCGGSGTLEEEDGDEVISERCPSCEGERLGPVGRRVSFCGHRLPELLAMTAPQLLATLETLSLDDRGELIAEGPVRAIIERARFLVDVGLDYLTLDRSVRSLSGGEAQRIRLAAQLGAHLSGVLYVLDEPTIGLHPTDTDILLGALARLQLRGNGVLMVEHDEATLRTADVLVDMGPGAGREGGEVLVAGPLSDALEHPDSLTGACLRDPRPPVRDTPRPLEEVPFVTLKGVQHHNLEGVDVRIPRGRLTVVSGVSGSGKSSLVHDVLARAIDAKRGGGTWESAEGLEGLERVVRVDDKPIGKNPRSIPATYIGVWSAIRTLFARLPEARLRGFTASRFSFNVKEGRCDACAGQGEVKLEMSFLPDAYTPCDTCGGRRFNAATLQVTYDGHSIHDVLELPVRDALTLFERVPKIQRAMQLLDDVGLGYLQLGQPSTTLSGGEAQRIKLVSQLIGRKRPDTLVVLDEPSIGLHMADVPKLLAVVHRLVDAGTTVVVIEHNVDVIREADWVIDLGPGGGPEGGRVLFEGAYEQLVGAEGSRTGAWLARQMSQGEERI